MHKQLNYLAWDSSFFGFTVGKFEGLGINREELEELIREAKANDYILLYLLLDTQVAPDVLNQSGQIILADEKVTYLQKAVSSPNWGDAEYPVYQVNERKPSKKLIELAIQSGEFSRFRVDKKIEEKKFEELYVRWISNSLSSQFAGEVWQWNENNDTLGFITLLTKNDRVEIGLLAVDSCARGRGIGKALVKKALHFTSIQGVDILQVVTQKRNTRACQFYQYNGFYQQDVKFVYHLWL